MERTTQHDIVADLIELSVRPGDAPRFPKGKRPSDDVLDRWARAAALAEPNAREAAVWDTRGRARRRGDTRVDSGSLCRARARRVGQPYGAGAQPPWLDVPHLPPR